MRKALSASAIKEATPKAKRYAISDVGHPGLRVVIYPSGKKSFVWRYKRASGQDLALVLGPAAGAGALTVSQARDAAGEARRQRALGNDPVESRRIERANQAARIAAAERESRRKDAVVPAVLARYYRDKVNAMKSAPELKRLLTKELAPWAKRRIDSIDRADAIKLIDDIKDRGTPVLANRARAAARTFFGWAIDKALIDENPFERTKPVVREVQRKRFLSDNEISIFWRATEQMDWIWQAFFRLLILTGQRRDEVAECPWSEIDLHGAVWTLPEARTKNKREHFVPLAPSVTAILRGMPKVQIATEANGTTKLENSPLVLTTTGTTPISGFSGAKEKLDRTMKKITLSDAKKHGHDPVVIAPWRIHDLRRSVAAGMRRIGISMDITEKTLNHVSGAFAGIVGNYQVDELLPDRRRALELWAAHVEGLTVERESNIVPIRAEG